MDPRRRCLCLLIGLGWLPLGGCDRDQAAEYLPLEPWVWWHYRIERTTMDGTRLQKFFLRNLPARDVDGRSVVVRQSMDGAELLLSLTSEGVARIGVRRPEEDAPRLDPSPRLVLPSSLEVGRQWRALTRTTVLEKTGPPQETLYRIAIELPMDYVIESLEDTVSVPAGRFAGCVRVRGRAATNAAVGNYIGTADIRVESTDWYAPGVGLVKSERKETTSSPALDAGRYVMELVEIKRG